MVSILRDVKKLIINATVAIKFVTFKLGDKGIESDSKILFPDGFISINSKSKALIQNNEKLNSELLKVKSNEDLHPQENELKSIKQKLNFHQDENLRLSHELSNSQKKYKLITYRNASLLST